MLYTIDIPGRPQAKGRPRFATSGHAYTPERTKNAEDIMRGYMRAAYRVPLKGPLELSVIFYFRRPDSWSKARRDAVDEGEEPWYIGKPDLDNLAKLVKDAANGVLWHDDAQVVSMEVGKCYGRDGLTSIRVRQAEEE